MTMRGMILVLAMLSASASAQRATVDEVDPFIGTSGEGHTFPGAVAPFGMVQLSPDTDTQCALRECYGHAAGYRHDDPTIEGFSHTHFSGAGHSDLGDLLVMPVSGDDVPMDPGTPDKPGYRSPFRHATEVTRPGYYAVTLDRPGVRAELTAATRAGVHRYSFPADKAAHLVIDLRSSLYNYPGKILWSGLRLRPDGTLTGFRETRGWAPGRKFFFAMRFSAPLVAHALVNREADIAYKGFQGPGRGSDAVAERLGRALMARLDFGKLDRPLEVKVAISGVDEAGAIANLDSEPGNFDAIRNRTNAAWTQALGAIELEGPAPMRRMVATALYHSLLAPSIWSDSDGRYRGPDDQVHRAQGFTFRSTFSLWDTFRAEHPLLTLIQPEKVNAEIIQSLIASRENSPDGILPVWQFHGRETWTMIGYHAVPVIADAYMKGIRGYDADAALDAMVASARYAPYGGLGEYMKRGYVPIDREPEAASKTVEYAYDDWAIAHMAAAMGRRDIVTEFTKRAGNWRNSFDTKTGFLRARKADGSWREPFDPTAINYGSDYTEGNAWQYSWFVPHDQAGLFQTMGGDAAVVAKLDRMFDYDNSKLDYSHAEDIAGLIGQYIHGNEPSHHVAYLYSYAGQPWRTQERLKQIVDSQYKPTPDGLSGNDDLGQMSAWLAFTAIGFYPVTPGTNQYVIGRPFLRRTVLNLPNGKRFVITAEGLSDANRYVGSVTLNGRPLARGYIRHEEIVAGGTLAFRMTARPNRTWAVAARDQPYSDTH
ncbi:sugar hydrolase [Sphingomonas paucimobilis]|uniref:GH92 family glycosyl hydrolase n=3 Tax=Sphingomonadaceae TaxID=41297 RepID=A0A411LFR4_SPHPI|nr:MULTISPECIES: GH92 family glycosyl hydrolase [Sphingomonas]MBQ1479997.1 GH92 family glycosyl hydrolase [Sphingomonas sp.]MCM3679100.1 GH92 family glycosyl hydrolase [Sphingomonas paucimobilis]MDG5971854.1 GH92 family glycosyl hydrolase [Sphingomonas paucimobilis]NNG58136.1 glycoside hydrolase family 92 protein [Sphingomonas paucimobilis]QBE91181.1 glycoside hydrolase family 92 protein [Sphingomonas paucimobilis]